MRITVQAAVVAILTLAVPPLAQGQGVTRAGEEFQVNTYTTSYQYQPAVCSAPDGQFVVVWVSYPNDTGDDIIAQRYSSSGDPVGTEFQVNTYTFSYQQLPRVCCGATANFVVVWESNTPDGDDFGIFGQRYAGDGSPQGTEFQVNTTTVGDNRNPDIGCAPDGRFVVTWESDDQDINGVFGQRYASDGSPAGTEFQINTYTTNDQEDARVCSDADGNFVIVWESYNQDGDDNGVFGQRFAANGALSGTEFQVNSYTSSNQYNPQIACDKVGGFTVVWDGSAQDGSFDGVFGQRFNSGGALVSAEFQVNTYTTGDQYQSSICCDGGGTCTVAWRSDSQDGSGDGIIARTATAGGAASSEFPVNTYTTGIQGDPEIACNDQGGFVVVWESFDQDGDRRGVFGQRFSLSTATAAPALSIVGLGATVIGLLGVGRWMLRRRIRPSADTQAA